MLARALMISALIVAIVAAATAIGLAGRALAAPSNSVVVTAGGQPTGISVSGEGKVMLPPDVATLNLGVETRAKTVEEARAQAAQAMEALRSRLTALGIDKKDIRTQSVSITPDYRPKSLNGDVQIDGYRVSNMVQVTVRRLDNVSKAIDGAAGAAGDAVRVHGVSFGVENPEEALRQAREQAMRDARAKAEQLARLSGVNVGRPISIQDGQVQGPIIPERMALGAAASDMATPIEPGQSTVRLVLNVVFAIE